MSFKNNRGKLVLAGLLILVSMFIMTRVSYAFFQAIIDQTNKENVDVSTANLSANYDDGDLFTFDYIMPGDYKYKKITITNTGDTPIIYNLSWIDVENNVPETTDFIYTFYGSSNSSDGQIGSGFIQGSLYYLPYTTNKNEKSYILKNIYLPVGGVHTYNIKFELVETGVNQSHLMGTSFSGKFHVDGVEQTQQNTYNE
jgi:hypothetical protein